MIWVLCLDPVIELLMDTEILYLRYCLKLFKYSIKHMACSAEVKWNNISKSLST